MKLPLFLSLFAIGVLRTSAVMIDEIQVYDDSINDPGKFGLELHLNTTLRGREAPDYPGEIVPNRGLRLTPEFSYGLSRDFEVGLYVPMERTADGAYEAAGAKLRLKWIPLHPNEQTGGWFLGANGELSRLSQRFEEARWTFELRTMIGYRAPEWLVVVNPVFGWNLAGPNRSGRPEGELQIKAAHELVKGVAFGPEYYAGFGPLGKPVHLPEQDHALYAAWDVDLKPWVFNFGIGHGLTRASDRWTAKFIFEVPW